MATARSSARDAADLCWLPATELAGLIRRRKVSPLEVVNAILDRIDRLNPHLNAYVTLTADQARRDARAAERALGKRGVTLGPLHGVPFSVKDLVITKGVRTTFGTPLYRDNVPTEDAPIVARMKAAGGIMLGKTNTPTFGWIGATHNLLYGITRNPWNLDRTPGGSSGGASAAAAAGLGPLHVGTDGGGSIRIPASCTGIVGFKPSFGRVPLYPASGAWSLSHAGPMTRTVADAALMLSVMAGPDDRDATCLDAPPADYVGKLEGGVRGLRIAFSPNLDTLRVDPEVASAVAAAARAFEALGAKVEEVKTGFADSSEMIRLVWGAHYIGNYGQFLDEWRGRMDPGLVACMDEAKRMTAQEYVAMRGRKIDSPERVEAETVQLRGQPLPWLAELRAAESPLAAVRELARGMLRRNHYVNTSNNRARAHHRDRLTAHLTLTTKHDRRTVSSLPRSSNGHRSGGRECR